MDQSHSLHEPALSGVHAAIICPMSDDGTIEPTDLGRHAVRMTNAEGIQGLLVNGHAGEGHLLSQQERGDVLKIVRSATGRAAFITAGVTSESTRAACLEAETAARSGANAVLVFPPSHWSRGVDDDVVVEHHRAITQAAGLPILLYKAPISWQNLSYRPDLIARLTELDAVVGIKEGSWEVSSYEEVWRLVKARRPGVAVMASGDEHLLGCFQIGTDGSQVSLAAIMPELIVGLFQRAACKDWDGSRALHDRIYPLARAIYRDAPSFMATTRIKAALRLLGQIGSDRIRQPMRQLTATEIAALDKVIRQTETAHASGTW